MPESTHRLRRFHVDGLPPEAGTRVRLSPEEAHHAAHVLRLPAGQIVELFDGRGGRATGRFEPGRRGEAAVVIDQLMPPRPRRGVLVHLAVAVPKGDRLDWLLQKATELGAGSLTPVRFQRGVAGGGEMSEHKRRRWVAQCVSAAKQCGVDFLPELCPAAAMGELVGRWGGDLKLLGEAGEGGQAVRLPDALARRRADQAVVLLVGPEGGLTEQEAALADEAGFLPVRIGQTTLRVETAAIALLAAVVAMA